MRDLSRINELAPSHGCDNSWAMYKGEIQVNCTKEELFRIISATGMHVEYKEGSSYFVVTELKDHVGWPIRIFFTETDGAIGLIKIHDLAAYSRFINEVVNKSEVLSITDHVRALSKAHSSAKETADALPEYTNPQLETIPETETGIIQSEYCISRESIGTVGMGPCIGLSITNEETGEHYFAHIDATTIFNLPSELNNWKQSTVVLVGGQVGQSEKTIQVVVEGLKKSGFTEINKHRLLNSNETVLNLSVMPVESEGKFRPHFSENVSGKSQKDVRTRAEALALQPWTCKPLKRVY